MAGAARHGWAIAVALGVLSVVGPGGAVALADGAPAGASGGLKANLSKIGSIFSAPEKPTPLPDKDAISLATQSNAGPELHVAVARLHEQAGRTAEAEAQYQAALRKGPKDLGALLGYAQLMTRAGRSGEAEKLYQQAAKAHPTEAAVFNNLGLCLAQQQRPDEAIVALTRAVELKPTNALYRNNLAAVLVDRGRLRDAFGHMQVVHGDAVAYYNLGYLLQKKGKTEAAVQHFALALRFDPTLEPSRQWLARLSPETLRQLPPTGPAPAASAPRIGNRAAPTSRSDLPPVAPGGRSMPGPSLNAPAAEPPPAPAAPTARPSWGSPRPTADPTPPRHSGASTEIRRLPPTEPTRSSADGIAPLPPVSQGFSPPAAPRGGPPVSAPLPPDVYLPRR